MAYKLRCNLCDQVFTVQSSNGICPSSRCRGGSTSFIGEVLDVAVDVAATYVMLDVAEDLLSGVGDLIGSLFD